MRLVGNSSDSYNDCGCVSGYTGEEVAKNTYSTDKSACTHFELISPNVCEFDMPTDENRWLFLGIDTDTPEDCMHEVLKRDSSSGNMATEPVIGPTKDWQGCQHRMFMWSPIAYDNSMSRSRHVYGRCACLPASTASSGFTATSSVRETDCTFPGKFTTA